MPVYRRIVEIYTGEEKNLFRTVRVDSDEDLDDEDLVAEMADLIDSFRRRYETQIRFVPPREDLFFADFLPQIEGEDNWDWGESDDEEYI